MARTVGLAGLVWLTTFTVVLVVSNRFRPFIPIEGVAQPTAGETIATVLPINLLVATLLILGGFTFGALTWMELIWVAVFFGVQVGSLVSPMGISGVLWATLPHCLVEIPAFWLASAVGIRGGRIFLDNMTQGAVASRAELLRLASLGAVSMGLLILAALVEGYVTPLLMGGV